MKERVESGIDIDINVNKERLDDTIDELKELNDNRPNITIRNNKNVYVTINNFNETEKEYNKELITEDKMQESFNYINNKLGKEY